MAFSKVDSRQDVASVVIEGVTLSDLTSGTALPVAEAPFDGIVVGGHITVVDPFDSATSDTGTVGDEDDDDRYASGVDLSAAAGTTTELTVAGHKYTTLKDFVFKWTQVGGGTTKGEVRIVINYVRAGQADFTQG